MKKIKKRNWIIVSIFMVLTIVISGGVIYVNSLKTPSNIEVSEDQKIVEVKKGQKFTINLTSNPSTGYVWSIDDIYNKNIISKTSNEFIASNSEMIGAPGKELWVFKGINNGSTKLNFVYSRQRENKNSQINSKIFNITVN